MPAHDVHPEGLDAVVDVAAQLALDAPARVHVGQVALGRRERVEQAVAEAAVGLARRQRHEER